MTSGPALDLPLFQVDAFSDQVFRGNPAAVVPLDQWLPAETMQAIAAENNLSETAFFVRDPERTLIRWFTPQVEVALCGHATLASAFVITTLLEPDTTSVRFLTKDGLDLGVERKGDLWELDFPALAPSETPLDAHLAAEVGGNPRAHYVANGRTLLVYESAHDVRALTPDFGRLRERGAYVIATAPGSPAKPATVQKPGSPAKPATVQKPGSPAKPATVQKPGDDVDFVSRYFAAPAGIDEDPVTGSAHCVLVPYWAARLGRTALRAHQISHRGGRLWCELRGDRVGIAGRAALYLSGRIRVPAGPPPTILAE